MKTHQLNLLNRFIDPMWLNKVKGKHEVTVNIDGTITLLGETLRFNETCPFEPDTKVVICFDRNFYAYSVKEWRETQLHNEAKRRNDQATEQLRRKQTRIEAETFNAKIKLPVKWATGIKDVLSGLSEKSYGNGRNRKTVEHIYLLDTLKTGRLIREAGDFLCSVNQNKNGKRWSSQIEEYSIDGEGDKHSSKVTCKQCLKIARKWILNN